MFCKIFCNELSMTLSTLCTWISSFIDEVIKKYSPNLVISLSILLLNNQNWSIYCTCLIHLLILEFFLCLIFFFDFFLILPSTPNGLQAPVHTERVLYGFPALVLHVKLDMTSFMSLILWSIYIIIDGDGLWYNTLDNALSSLNTFYSSRNSPCTTITQRYLSVAAYSITKFRKACGSFQESMRLRSRTFR